MADSASESPSHSASVDPDEIARFAALAEEWWDPAGKFAPLHRLNSARLTFIRDRIAAHAGRDPLAERSLAEVRFVKREANRNVLSRIGMVSGGRMYEADQASIEKAYLRISAEQ